MEIILWSSHFAVANMDQQFNVHIYACHTLTVIVMDSWLAAWAGISMFRLQRKC